MVFTGGDIRKICPNFSFDKSILELIFECLQRFGDNVLQVNIKILLYRATSMCGNIVDIISEFP